MPKVISRLMHPFFFCTYVASVEPSRRVTSAKEYVGNVFRVSSPLVHLLALGVVHDWEDHLLQNRWKWTIWQKRIFIRNSHELLNAFIISLLFETITPIWTRNVAHHLITLSSLHLVLWIWKWKKIQTTNKKCAVRISKKKKSKSMWTSDESETHLKSWHEWSPFSSSLIFCLRTIEKLGTSVWDWNSIYIQYSFVV